MLYFPAMEEETLYWVLSTIPQVAAAFVAFVGFLGISSLEESRRRRTEIEIRTKEEIKRTYEALSLEGFQGRVRTLHEIETMSGQEIMKRLGESKNNPKARHLMFYYDTWKGIDDHVKDASSALRKFVITNLSVAGVTLSLLLFVPDIVSLPTVLLAVVLVAVSTGMVGMTGYFVLRFLRMPRF